MARLVISPVQLTSGDKPSTVNQNCPSVPKVTTSAVDDGKVVVDGPTSEKEGTDVVETDSLGYEISRNEMEISGCYNSNLSMSGLECHLHSSYPSTAKQHPLNWASPQQRYLRSSMAPLSHSYLDPDPSAFYVQSPFGDTGNHFDMVSIL